MPHSLPPVAIPSATIAGLEKPVSKLVMGVDNQNAYEPAAALYDAYLAAGGNTFDTAHIYGKLRSRLLGRWVRERGARDRVVIIAKGIHSPRCEPRWIRPELEEQLGWLGMDHADLYLMHRDNPEVAVGDFVEALNEQVRAGRIRLFGASNWTIERVQAANDYAARHRLQGLSALSNCLALADMPRVIWPGCLQAHDMATRRWLEYTQMPLFSWSSQAKAFFVPGRAAPDKTDDANMVRTWYSADNFERRRRAFALAEEKGVEPIHIALAWVLKQPFPSFPIIGPRTLQHLFSSLRALEVALSDEEWRWLDLLDDEPPR
ncbi:MAG: aldo/keto reductase [Kiritimatiellia bacterium]